mmetsp:Transcript_58819/g.140058  ORF Transcript_58819/g.140058 Transcript_58819/m.140058 type:complete len:217 (+) Transcript_58819:483-1133(+)
MCTTLSILRTLGIHSITHASRKSIRLRTTGATSTTPAPDRPLGSTSVGGGEATTMPGTPLCGGHGAILESMLRGPPRSRRLRWHGSVIAKIALERTGPCTPSGMLESQSPGSQECSFRGFAVGRMEIPAQSLGRGKWERSATATTSPGVDGIMAATFPTTTWLLSTARSTRTSTGCIVTRSLSIVLRDLARVQASRRRTSGCRKPASPDPSSCLAL